MLFKTLQTFRLRDARPARTNPRTRLLADYLGRISNPRKE